MLVTFSCDAHENITMFGEVAIGLLKLMGHSGTVPSALLAQEVPEALDRLQNAIESVKKNPPPKPTKNDEDEEPPISLAHRAIPLIELLQDAVRKKCNVMWK